MVKKLKISNMKQILLVTALAGTMLLGGCAAQTTTTSDETATEAVSEDTTTDTSTEELTDSEVPDAPPDSENGFDESSGSSVETTGVLTIDGTTETLDREDLTSTVSNESTIKVTNAGSLTLTNSTLNKASGEMTVEEASDFFGANAGVLAEAASTINLTGITIQTTATGGNAVFSTGEGTTVNLSDVTITTTKDHSRGLDATYEGTINADNVSIQTAGAHSAAVATDRGEGTVTVANSILNTSGEGSPCIYSTGDITVTDTTGTASGSLIAAIEGKNSITLFNSTLTGYGIGRGTGGIDDCGVIVYQSMSGDSSEGVGTFTSTDSSLAISEDSEKYTTSPMFFVTNTSAIFNLTNTDLSFGSGILLSISGNDGEWGTAGSNGGLVTFNAADQILTGDILVDEISTLDLILTNSELTSTVNSDNTASSLSISLDKNSIWNVTGNSYVTVLTNEDTSCSNIISNGNTIYYDASNSANTWLDGQTIELSDGGIITPM